MPYTLVLNSSNVVGSNNSVFKYNFINGAFTINEDSEMCVSQIVIPYSWFNINKAYYTNATLQYQFPQGVTSKPYTVNFPNGYYSVSDLNNYLQLYMVKQNQYFYNSTTGTNLYYIQIVTNTTYYSNQIIVNPVPTSLPSGYSLPSTVINGYTYSGFNCNPTSSGGDFGSTTSFYPTSTLTPQVIIPTYTGIYGLGSIIGFIGGTYPATAQSTSYNVLSNTTPNATPVNSIVVRSDIVNNPCAMPSDILDTFSISSSFGSNITYTPPYEKWISIQAGTYASLAIAFQDQNFTTLQANDPNVLIALLLRQGKKRPAHLNRIVSPLVKQLEFKDEKGMYKELEE
jgi:hypothetical protein